MTERGKERGARALLQAVCSTSGHHFPKVFVVGDSVFFMRNAAERMRHWLEYDQIVQFRHGWLDKHVKYEVETLTIEDAYEHVYGRPMPYGVLSIDRGIDQKGDGFVEY